MVMECYSKNTIQQGNLPDILTVLSYHISKVLHDNIFYI